MVLWSAVFYCCYDNINDFVAIVAALSLWLVSAAGAWTVTTTSADPADDEILKTHRFSSDNFDVYFRSASRWTARATHANGARTGPIVAERHQFNSAGADAAVTAVLVLFPFWSCVKNAGSRNGTGVGILGKSEGSVHPNGRF